MRAASIFIIVALVLGSTPALAQKSKLLLEEQPRTNFTVYGWTFLLLSLGTLAYGAKAYDDSQEDLDNADANFASYQTASSASEATTFRNAANENLNDARANESRANLALWLGIIFAATSWYSFNAEDLPESGLALTRDSVILRYRF